MSDGSNGQKWWAAERRQHLVESLTAILLSLAALGSAYSAFQSDLWDGEQSAYYVQAVQARTAASKEESVALQLKTVDALVFTQWLNAHAAGRPTLESFYRARFRPSFGRQFEQWIATQPETNPAAPATPFEMAGYDADRRQKEAVASPKAAMLFEKGEHANDVSDYYGQSMVLFALSLFLGGIMQTFERKAPRRILLSLAVLCCVLAFSRALTLPAIRLI